MIMGFRCILLVPILKLSKAHAIFAVVFYYIQSHWHSILLAICILNPSTWLPSTMLHFHLYQCERIHSKFIHSNCLNQIKIKCTATITADIHSSQLRMNATAFNTFFKGNENRAFNVKMIIYSNFYFHRQVHRLKLNYAKLQK